MAETDRDNPETGRSSATAVDNGVTTGNYFPPNRLVQGFARWLHTAIGWKHTGQLPDLPKYVVVVAHHTSNWDFVVCLILKLMLRLRVRFLAKHTLFKQPLGWFMFRWGGVPVKRDKAHNLVAQVVAEIARNSNFILAVTPDGTRGPVKGWKKGFYHIARKADIPVVPIALDYANKTIVINEPVYLTRDEEADMEKIYDHIRPYKPKFPEHAWSGPENSR